ncbi:hypothetical protein [Paraglaciecola sp.]|uniref:hypothetical protein n=1 Tax=Paraglaciecola sp. TaxID=1920173 RepID=UPI0032672596
MQLGQPLYYQIEEFSNRQGFEIFDSSRLVGWKHKYLGEIELSDKTQYIGYEMQFIKKDVHE